jgi:mono/diheme cytochrome c family protein
MHVKWRPPAPLYGTAIATVRFQMQAARLLGVLALVAFSAMAGAQDLGDPREGLRYAQKMCAGCHAVLPGQVHSPMPDAPSFGAVADTPGMTATALIVWFRGSHPLIPKTMPNIVVEDDDMDNVVAYILSLKTKR